MLHAFRNIFEKTFSTKQFVGSHFSPFGREVLTSHSIRVGNRKIRNMASAPGSYLQWSRKNIDMKVFWMSMEYESIRDDHQLPQLLQRRKSISGHWIQWPSMTFQWLQWPGLCGWKIESGCWECCNTSISHNYLLPLCFWIASHNENAQKLKFVF